MPGHLDLRSGTVILTSVASPSELKQAIVTYEHLIASYTIARERIVARRKSAADNVMVELDDRLKANARTIESLRRALEVTQEHLRSLERGRG
jgi:hypothetical protein